MSSIISKDKDEKEIYLPYKLEVEHELPEMDSQSTFAENIIGVEPQEEEVKKDTK